MRIFFLLAVLFAVVPTFAASHRLVIHEWGTFTSLQDEDGYALGGINGDDEVLPTFVHDLIRDASQAANPFGLSKGGVPSCFPSVTMRLETPVLYFHPAPGQKLPPLDVSAEFRGGLLTQFYPTAVAPTPKLVNGVLETLTEQTTGKLAWSGLTVGGSDPGPQSTSHVWTTPREVSAANVRATSGESEKFLFYRGVGHVNAPARLVRNGSRIEVRGQIDFEMQKLLDLAAPAAWFCEIQPDGRCAWRSVGALNLLSGDQPMASVAPFLESEFTTENLASLKTAMHAALVRDGLFPDEATAMLNTWELSYFKSAGTRLFFIVPRSWTGHVLPLRVSTDAEIQRVMVGRIDLVTPQQRAELRRLASLNPQTDGPAITESYKALGRFYAALMLDEHRRRPSPTLETLLRSVGVNPASR